MNRLLQKELEAYPRKKTYQRMLENQLLLVNDEVKMGGISRSCLYVTIPWRQRR